MKPFLAIISHNVVRGTLQKAARETYLKEWGHLIDYRFVLGNGNEDEQSDEWIFPVNDGYNWQAHKWQATFRRVLEGDHDFVFLTGPDDYVIIPRLLQVEPAGQYVGDPINEYDAIIAGGAGIWFGRQAMEVIVRQNFPELQFPDMEVARALKRAGIAPATDTRYLYVSQDGAPFAYNDCAAWEQRGGLIVVHLGRGTGRHNAQWTYEAHEGFMKCHRKN